MEKTPLIPRALLFGNPERNAPVISPNGEYIAYLAPVDSVMNIWVRNRKTGEERALTSDAARPIRVFYWQYDSSALIYLQDSGGDENFHLFRAPLSGTAVDLTPFEGARVSDIFLTPHFPNTAMVGLNRRSPQVADMYRLELDTGELTLNTTNPGDIAGWQCNHNTEVCAGIRVTEDGSQQILTPNQEGGWSVRYTAGPEESGCNIMGVSPDNQALWIGSSVDANAQRLLELPLQQGEAKVLAEDPIYDAGNIFTHPLTNELQGVLFVRERSEWVPLCQEFEEDLKKLTSAHAGDIVLTGTDLQNSIWTVAFVLDNAPAAYCLYHRETGQVELLFSSRPELESYVLSPMQLVSFTARDGMQIYGYLTLPAGEEPKNLPLVLLVHGGPWARDVWGFSSMVQWLANRGYAVLQINYRGSTGYGKAYLNAGDMEWAGKMQTDLLDGKQWAVEQGFVDASKVAIMGGSYGGYATLVGLTFTPLEFACGVDIVGPSNINTLLATIPPYWKPALAMFYKRVGSDPDFLLSRSPLTLADCIERPLLIAQGANDPRVKKSESDQIVQSARSRGKKIEYLVFPDEGHGFARPENECVFTAAAEVFLGLNLGGRVEQPSPEENSEPFEC